MLLIEFFFSSVKKQIKDETNKLQNINKFLGVFVRKTD